MSDKLKINGRGSAMGPREIDAEEVQKMRNVAEELHKASFHVGGLARCLARISRIMGDAVKLERAR